MEQFWSNNKLNRYTCRATHVGQDNDGVLYSTRVTLPLQWYHEYVFRNVSEDAPRVGESGQLGNHKSARVSATAAIYFLNTLIGEG